jgi:hypothetical protein
VFLIDDLLLAPGRAVLFLFEELAKKAREEMLDDGPLKQQLQEIYALLESGKISDREFEAAEFELVQRLDAIARAKLGGSQDMAEPDTNTVDSGMEMMPAAGLINHRNVIDVEPVDVPAPPPPAPPPPPAKPPVDILALLRQAFGPDAVAAVAPAPLERTVASAPVDRAVLAAAMPDRQPVAAPPPAVVAAPVVAPPAMPAEPPVIAPAPPLAESAWPAAAAGFSSRPAVPVTSSLTISQVIDCTMRGLAMLKLRVSALTSAARDEEGWRVTAEVIERKSVPDTSDLLGIYELRLDEAGNLLRYERTRMRRRCDLAGR